jgi:hypothetical protein
MKFAPLKEVTEIRQFVGSSNWVRRYLVTQYAAAVKILGEYMKEGVKIPVIGLGHPDGKTKGDMAVKAIN